MFRLVCEYHTVQTYSDVGQMKVLYAITFNQVALTLTMHSKKLRVMLVLQWKLCMCYSFCCMAMPRYITDVTVLDSFFFFLYSLVGGWSTSLVEKPCPSSVPTVEVTGPPAVAGLG